MRRATDAVLYGFPLYRAPREAEMVFRVPFIKVNLHNDVMVNAYRYLVYRFSQYAYLSKGAVIRNYDPSTGTMNVELPPDIFTDPINEVNQLYSEFVSEYLAPRLVKAIRRAEVDAILSVFYRKTGEGAQTGLSSVILPVKHVEAYINEITSGKKFALQQSARNKFSKNASKITACLSQLKLKEDDIVVVNKLGDVMPLTEEDIEEELKSMFVTSNVSTDVKSIRGIGRCCYCGMRATKLWFTATGKLGLGRYKLPHEDRTDFSGEASVCLKCVLVAMYYVLDGGERTLMYTFNGLPGALRLEKGLVKGTSVDVAIAIANEIRTATPREWAEALAFNSALGDEKATVSIEGFDEVALERLALLSSLFSPGLLRDEGVQRALLGYARGSFPSFVSHLSYFLKQSKKTEKSEKGGGMSYVSKEIHRYITPHLYRETEDMRVAYTIAAIAESVVYNLKQAGADDYTIRKFADTVRNGLTTAIAYAIPRLERELRTLRIPDFADKTIIKEVLDKYGFRYEEKEGAIYIDIGSIPAAEIRIRESHGAKVMLKAYDMLTLLAPEIAVGATKKEEEKGESSVQQ